MLLHPPLNDFTVKMHKITVNLLGSRRLLIDNWVQFLAIKKKAPLHPGVIFLGPATLT